MAAPALAGSMARAGFTSGIVDREPQDDLDALTNDHVQVYFFTELRDMQGRTVIHRWMWNGEVMGARRPITPAPTSRRCGEETPVPVRAQRPGRRESAPGGAACAPGASSLEPSEKAPRSQRHVLRSDFGAPRTGGASIVFALAVLDDAQAMPGSRSHV
jgi:hypothetical protein